MRQSISDLLGSRGRSPFVFLPSGTPKVQRFGVQMEGGPPGSENHAKSQKVTFPVMNKPITKSSQTSQNDVALIIVLLRNV